MRISSSALSSAVAAALLAATPAATLWAQSASPAARSAEAPAPSPEPPAERSVMARVEAHIKRLHADLHITPAEKQEWDQFAQVMRENARDMSAAFVQRAEHVASMNAVQSLQSYEKLAQEHVERLQKLIPAFENLYNAMSPQQKQLADRVFRASAERHARGHRR